MRNTLNRAYDLVQGLGRLSGFRPVDKNQFLSIGSVVAQTARRAPNEVMIVTVSTEQTWGEFNQRANQFAHYFKAHGVLVGDSVGILMENEPDMLAALVGVCKLGAVAALINTNLTGRSLQHCIDAVGCKKIVFGGACINTIDEIRSEREPYELLYLDSNTSQVQTPSPDWALNISDELASQSQENPSETEKLAINSPAYYIFTSGTTGLPKAALVTHYHWYRAASSFSKLLLRLKQSDRIYVCLPLYHTAAMLIGFGASSISGSSFYLAKKFSASRFWGEIRESNSNIFLYIGELCRYLLNAPFDADDGDNPLTTCVGNGLRPELWHSFKNRFSISKVAEYYGSTEGNLAFMNILNRDCTFGMGLGSYKVVNYSEENGDLVKNSRGFCTTVQYGEVGLLITKISEKTPFYGYTDKNATESKIMRNVFELGDRFVNTGDLIRRTNVGFTFGIPHYQFVDRVGDTFRWKGENVSTSEVADVINGVPGVMLSSVYGVSIPGSEGRAGMVALVVDDDIFSITTFSQVIDDALPAYARPIFVRIMAAIETTETHKVKKLTLQKEAYDISIVGDKILVKKAVSSEYVVLEKGFHQTIICGKSGF